MGGREAADRHTVYSGREATASGQTCAARRRLTGAADGAGVPGVPAVAAELLRVLRAAAAVLAGVRVAPVLHFAAVDHDVALVELVLRWRPGTVSQARSQNGDGHARKLTLEAGPEEFVN